MFDVCKIDTPAIKKPTEVEANAIDPNKTSFKLTTLS